MAAGVGTTGGGSGNAIGASESTNTLGGADVKTELAKATEAFKPILDKENAAG